MIQIEKTSFSYENAVNNAGVTDIDLEIQKGQVVLLCGESGSGKTTACRLINGLIPHYYEGDLWGNILISDKDTSQAELYELAPLIGSVFQNPKSQFYTLLTDTEIVFACENLGMERDNILERFDQSVRHLELFGLLGKNLFALSGGEKQKIACASVDALSPEIFVLDEPSSNLDIKTIGDMRKILLNWKKQGKTVVISEHRLSWLKGIVDRVLFFKDGKIEQDINADIFWKRGMDELHLMGLRAPCSFCPQSIESLELSECLEIKNAQVSYAGCNALDIPGLQIPKGAVVAVLGNNGAGKTTFARWLCGLFKKAEGMFKYNGRKYGSKQRIQLFYMVLQDVNHQLFSESVLEELLISVDPKMPDREMFVDEILSSLDLGAYKEAHPMSLSGGQRQRVAIATALASKKEVIIFDEPTSGLDYRHMQKVAQNIRALSQTGKTQFVITHDPELVEACCDYFVLFKAGSIESSGGWTNENTKLVSEYFRC